MRHHAEESLAKNLFSDAASPIHGRDDLPDLASGRPDLHTSSLRMRIHEADLPLALEQVVGPVRSSGIDLRWLVTPWHDPRDPSPCGRARRQTLATSSAQGWHERGDGAKPSFDCARGSDRRGSVRPKHTYQHDARRDCHTWCRIAGIGALHSNAITARDGLALAWP